MGTVTLVFVVVTRVITCSFMELGCFVSYTQAANHFRKCGKTSLWMVWSGNCDPGHHEVFKSLLFFLYSPYSPANKHIYIYMYIDMENQWFLQENYLHFWWVFRIDLWNYWRGDIFGWKDDSGTHSRIYFLKMFFTRCSCSPVLYAVFPPGPSIQGAGSKSSCCVH